MQLQRLLLQSTQPAAAWTHDHRHFRFDLVPNSFHCCSQRRMVGFNDHTFQLKPWQVILPAV